MNHLESNTEAHVDHDVKLTIILALVTVQLLLTAIEIFKKTFAHASAKSCTISSSNPADLSWKRSISD